jgi:hypothetical protein
MLLFPIFIIRDILFFKIHRMFNVYSLYYEPDESNNFFFVYNGAEDQT